ncbi:MAG: adenylosuccinate synthase [Pirellulaceae bacterium]
MAGTCIIGLQWGDEAKGKLVDLLTKDMDVVVRYQGGANAGHTVVVGDQVYKLHHIPSGIINKNVLNIVAAGVVVHPATILREINSLLDRGLDIRERLLLSDRAHVVMPWHLIEDQLWNVAVTGDNNIGTTLRGIGPCYRDKVGRSYAVRLADLLRPDFADRVREIAAAKLPVLKAMSPDGKVDLDAEAIIEEFRDYIRQLRPYILDTTRVLLDLVEQDKRILYEGAQGSLLDIDHGTFPFVTSSNSSGVGISAGSGVAAKWLTKSIGVAKAYSTRVGGGPFPTELNNELGERIRQKGKEFGTTTGRPRRCGWFDAVAVRYTRRLGGIDRLALMMLDVLSGLSELKICVAYELDGRRIDYFPGSADELRRVVPIYETLPGWLEEIDTARELSDLPEKAIRYIQRIESLVGCKTEFISVGPDRVQTILNNQSRVSVGV